MSRRDQIEAIIAQGDPTIDRMMAGYSLDAADYANGKGFDLDYSPDSIGAVEEIVSGFYPSKPKGLSKLFRRQLSEDDVDVICKMFGGYLGEVMRLESGSGAWSVKEDGPFAGAIVLTRGSSQTSPPSKVFKRITDGPADELVAYYQVLMSPDEGDDP